MAWTSARINHILATLNAFENTNLSLLENLRNLREFLRSYLDLRDGLSQAQGTLAGLNDVPQELQDSHPQVFQEVTAAEGDANSSMIDTISQIMQCLVQMRSEAQTSLSRLSATSI